MRKVWRQDRRIFSYILGVKGLRVKSSGPLLVFFRLRYGGILGGGVLSDGSAWFGGREGSLSFTVC